MINYNKRKQFVFINNRGNHVFPVNHIFADCTNRNRDKRSLDLYMQTEKGQKWITGFTHVKSMRFCGKTVYVHLDLNSF